MFGTIIARSPEAVQPSYHNEFNHYSPENLVSGGELRIKMRVDSRIKIVTMLKEWEASIKTDITNNKFSSPHYKHSLAYDTLCSGYLTATQGVNSAKELRVWIDKFRSLAIDKNYPRAGIVVIFLYVHMNSQFIVPKVFVYKTTAECKDPSRFLSPEDALNELKNLFDFCLICHEKGWIDKEQVQRVYDYITVTFPIPACLKRLGIRLTPSEPVKPWMDEKGISNLQAALVSFEGGIKIKLDGLLESKKSDEKVVIKSKPDENKAIVNNPRFMLKKIMHRTDELSDVDDSIDYNAAFNHYSPEGNVAHGVHQDRMKRRVDGRVTVVKMLIQWDAALEREVMDQKNEQKHSSYLVQYQQLCGNYLENKREVNSSATKLCDQFEQFKSFAIEKNAPGAAAVAIFLHIKLHSEMNPLGFRFRASSRCKQPDACISPQNAIIELGNLFDFCLVCESKNWISLKQTQQIYQYLKEAFPHPACFNQADIAPWMDEKEVEDLTIKMTSLDRDMKKKLDQRTLDHSLERRKEIIATLSFLPQPVASIVADYDPMKPEPEEIEHTLSP